MCDQESIFIIALKHPIYTTGKGLNDWLSTLDIRSCPENVQLKWVVPSLDKNNYHPDLFINFATEGDVYVTLKNKSARRIEFVNSHSDSDRLQCLLDVLVNPWAKPGLIGIDWMDINAIFQNNDFGIIHCIKPTQSIPNYCQDLAMQGLNIRDASPHFS